MTAARIGVDPGATGAIVVLSDNGDPLAWTLMPTLKIGSNTQVNGAALRAFLLPHVGTHAYLEKVGAMPGQGVTSMFNFGHSCGVALGILVGLDLPMDLVTPQQWKKRAGLIGDDKDAARARAIQLWPWWRELDLKGKGQALADAALIAKYGGTENEATSPNHVRSAPRRVRLD
jgi:crossover junction endodeoxyribonuclease RuvC